MQVHVEKSKFIAEGQMASRSFSLALGPHIMSILSGLYSDIPWAIVREYGTNMLDGYLRLAHERGVDPKDFRPAQIHVPNPLEPWIEFRDYGIGMPFDVAWEVFTSYGASTKRDSNVEVGGLGLGSKSGFCYCEGEAWSVESRYDGQRHMFAAARGDDGTPQFVHADALDTIEPNGVTVKLPVRPADFGVFQRAVERFYQHYSLPLEVVGAAHIDLRKPVYAFETDTWALHEDRDPCSQKRPLVLMGNVTYPFPTSELETVKLAHGFKIRNDTPLVLKLPIGAIDVVPSREGLKWTNRTREAVLAAYAVAAQEVHDYIIKSIEVAETEWQAVTIMHSLPFSLGGDYKLPWRGKTISYSGIGIDLVELRKRHPDLNVRQVTRQTNRRRRNYDVRYKATSVLGKSDTENKITLRPGWQWAIVLDNLKGSGSTSRTGYWLSENYKDEGSAYVFRSKTLTPELLSEALMGAPLLKASDLPEPPRDYAANTVLSNHKASIRQLAHRSQNTVREFWTPVSDTPDGEKFFIPMKNGKPEGTETRTLYHIRQKLQELNVVDASAEIYGIPQTLMKLAKEDGWIEFMPWAKKQFKTLLKREKRLFSLEAAAVEASEHNLFTGMIKAGFCQKLAKGSRLRKLLEAVPKVEATRVRAQEIRGLAHLMGVVVPDRQTSGESLEDVYKHYPWLHHMCKMGSFYGYRVAEELSKNSLLLDHIKEVDAKASKK